MHSKRAESSLPFDWLMAILAALLMCGVLLDGWAHSHGFVDQSFITPWHAVLYGSMAVNGLVLLVAGIAGLRRGYTFVNALPPGYWMSAIGVLVFVLAGGFDFWWHTKFGIESGIVLLISPPHLILALAGAMVMSGPIQSIAVRYGPDTSGWKILGPAVISTWALITIVGFFLAYAQPIEDGFTPLTMHPSTSDAVYPMLYSSNLDGSLTRIGLPAKTDLETVAISPDGRHMVYRVNRYQDPDSLPPSDLYVANLDGSHATKITSSGNHDTQPEWSPDGKSIAYVSMPAETSGNFAIRLVSPSGGTTRSVFDQTATIRIITWSPKGDAIAYGSRNGPTTDEIATVDVKTGKTTWLPFTANAGTPTWTARGLVYATDDGKVVESQIDGSGTHTLVAKSDGSPAVSPDGKHIAYLNSELGGEQLFVADADGSKARDVSQLSGLDVQDAVFAPDGRVFFIALGRRDPTHTDIGKSLAMAAIIIQSILIAGGVLLLVRRWRIPFGALTLVLTFFALAMALQSDFYTYAIGAFATGLLADIAVAVFGDRMRHGFGYNALGFMVPLLFTAFFQLVTIQTGGGASGWVWNLLLGAPLLAGASGLFLAFCFDSPLERNRLTESQT
jgi:hypothetical protein